MSILDEVKEYVTTSHFREAVGLPMEVTEEYELLAQGEYNANYTFIHPVTGEKLVLRVNCGSQMHLENQIEYEANALKLLGNSGRTPKVCFVDGSEGTPGNGVLVMEFIEGTGFDYLDEAHMAGAASCLADIHSIEIPENHGLIEPKNSLKAILDECEEMLAVYLESDIPEDATKKRLRALLDNAWKLIPDGEDEGNYKCCINTELNSTNFIVGKHVSLVDWEKPLYGDPAQDLGHFLAPTTSFWKTDVIFTQEQINWFIEEYLRAVDGRYDTEGLRERTLAFITITCLRGMTWCAMAWVQYQSADKELINESTWIKLNQYLEDSFIAMIEGIIREALA